MKAICWLKGKTKTTGSN